MHTIQIPDNFISQLSDLHNPRPHPFYSPDKIHVKFLLFKYSFLVLRHPQIEPPFPNFQFSENLQVLTRLYINRNRNPMIPKNGIISLPPTVKCQDRALGFIKIGGINRIPGYNRNSRIIFINPSTCIRTPVTGVR